MKTILNLVVVLLLAAVGWYAWGQYQQKQRTEQVQTKRVAAPAASTTKAGGRDPLFFSCDARNTCAQMTSCEEAKFFLRNCPGMAEASGEGPSCIKNWCTK